MPSKEIQNNVVIETDIKEEPFNPNSQQLITVQDKDGRESRITVQDWLKQLNTNGRGGT